jgi:hypothetical protein
MNDELTPIEMAEALNKMDMDLNSWEADFHDNVLKLLRAGQQLSPGRLVKLKEVYEKYLGEDAESKEISDDIDL